MHDTVVVGAGLAGLSCAFKLSKNKKSVLVLEAHQYLGGRTASWVEDGMPVDSGLHKFLGIYRALPRLLEEVGVDVQKMLTWVDAMELHSGDGRKAYFRASPYRHPLETFRDALRNNHFLPMKDKLRLAGMGVQGLIDCAKNPDELDKRTVAEQARSWGVSEQTIQDVLHTLTSGVLFLAAEKFSSYAAFAPVLEGVKHGLTMRVGAFNGGMTDVMMKPIADAITRNGGSVRTGSSVSSLLIEREKVVGVECNGERITAQNVVIATPLGPAQKLLKGKFSEHSWFKPMLSLDTLSAVTLQCEQDEPIFQTDHTHFSNTTLCCFAEQAHTTFRHVRGRLSLILYPPKDFLELAPEEIFQRADADARRLGFQLKGQVKQYRVVRHPSDFYAMVPGSEALRPQQATPIPGLFLAGDYTKQPFSASMEGATLSGLMAAKAVLKNSQGKTQGA